jgi:DNA-directed RNA polymerase specialized sigma24 family protein
VEAVTLAVLASRAEDDDPIRALAALAELRRQIEQQEEIVVRRARVRGLSWAAIATLLGVSRQAVHRKHSGSRFGSGRA